MKMYHLLVAISWLMLPACTRISHHSNAVAPIPKTCVLSEMQKPMEIKFDEFEKQISAFEASQFPLDILVVEIRPGQADNELKRLIISPTGASLLAVRHNVQDSIFLEGSRVDTTTLRINVAGHYVVNDNSPFAHTHTLCTLVKRYGITAYTSGVTFSNLSCLPDSARQRIQPGVDLARWLLQLH